LFKKFRNIIAMTYIERHAMSDDSRYILAM